MPTGLLVAAISNRDPKGPQHHADQRQLLGWLAADKKVETMARLSSCSVRTVHRRIAELMQHLGARSRTEAVITAVQQDLLET